MPKTRKSTPTKAAALPAQATTTSGFIKWWRIVTSGLHALLRTRRWLYIGASATVIAATVRNHYTSIDPSGPLRQADLAAERFVARIVLVAGEERVRAD